MISVPNVRQNRAIALSYYACAPLFFEMAVEATHPAPEGTVVTVMTTAYNVGTLALLWVPVASAPAAFNWAFAGTVAVLTAALGVA